nr:CU044_5270 family protein [Trebonia sp.]
MWLVSKGATLRAAPYRQPGRCGGRDRRDLPHRRGERRRIAAAGAPHPAVVPSYGPAGTAAQLVDYATRAATAGPAFNPGPRQWIYTDVLQATSSAGTGGYLKGAPAGRLEQQTWTRADYQEYAYLKNGKLVIVASNLPRSAKTGQAVAPAPFGWPPVSYAYLNSLPTSPARLMAVIRDNLSSQPDPIGAEGTGNAGVFTAVQALMQNVVLPPRLLAALYGVPARDPVVRFERSVTDLAGRTGVGFSTVQEGYLEEQIVINPKTYAYMGYVDVAVRAHSSTGLDETARFRKGQILGWQALLGSGIVQHPGQLP